ncbi:MAG TPA: HupE/UreJ family protein [Candidatus Polarisedimenticolia bacterium]|nr:HupE/UreJ family protein [Candidatus Polarisedimenticolia bacterium]
MLALPLATVPVRAHDVRPAYLELREAKAGQEAHGPAPALEVFFKVPARAGGQKPLLALVWPAGTTEVRDPLSPGRFEEDAWVERFEVERAAGWGGTTIGVRGMENGLSDVLIRFERADGSSRTVRLTAGEPDFAIGAAPRRADVAATYTRLGVEHILTGVDHLLFGLALVLLTSGLWRLVRTVTAFTLAHSITLALATLGVVRVPQAPVEATIALSIVFAAAEVVRRHAGTSRLDPWLIAFTFGLLHGFGFAGALREVGLPQGAIVPALLFFNVGVEAGQLMFITVVLAVGWGLRRLPLPRPAWGWRVLPYAIGGVAAFWLMERVAAL